VGLVIAIAVAALAGLEHLTEVSLLATALAGALAGFLLHNWPPARIFLGDSGSLPLGFLVGALSLEASAKKAAGLTLAVPFVLLCIPMFDTSMAILRRKLNGRRIGQGDRAHIHHCLRDRGLSPTQTLLVMGGLCGVTAAAAILSTVLGNDFYALGTCALLLAFLIAGRVFGFDETMLLVRHVQAVGGFLQRAPRVLRARFVVVRLAESAASGRLDLWNKIVHRARLLPGVEVEFVCRHIPSGRELIALAWAKERSPAADSPTWHVSYSVPRGAGVCARAEARGVLPASGDALPYHELAEMLALLCRNWPVGAASPVDTAPRPAAPNSQEPMILSPHWPTTRTPRTGAVFPEALGSDARLEPAGGDRVEFLRQDDAARIPRGDEHAGARRQAMKQRVNLRRALADNGDDLTIAIVGDEARGPVGFEQSVDGHACHTPAFGSSGREQGWAVLMDTAYSRTTRERQLLNRDRGRSAALQPSRRGRRPTPAAWSGTSSLPRRCSAAT
jgi:hypothetical protein